MSNITKLNVTIGTVQDGVSAEVFSMGGAAELVARTARAQLNKVEGAEEVSVVIEVMAEDGATRTPLKASGDTNVVLKALKGALGTYAPRRVRKSADGTEVPQDGAETVTSGRRGRQGATGAPVTE